MSMEAIAARNSSATIGGGAVTTVGSDSAVEHAATAKTITTNKRTAAGYIPQQTRPQWARPSMASYTRWVDIPVRKKTIELTRDEKTWLQENPNIRLATLTNQPPFSMLDADRNHTGILADILALLNNAIGQKIEPRLVEGAVSDTHEVAKEKGVYGSASILKTSRHANEYLLTDPFMTTPFYIYATTKNRSEIRRPADLNGKRVAVPRNHRAVDEYLAGIRGVQTIPVDTPLEQMQKVVSGEADALIGYFTYPYLVNKYLMVDLVIAFIAKSDQGIHIGVNPEHPVLLGIINKAIATFDDAAINAITAKWTEFSREEAPSLELTPEEQA
mgnify:CR=1 FL=1